MQATPNKHTVIDQYTGTTLYNLIYSQKHRKNIKSYVCYEDEFPVPKNVAQRIVSNALFPVVTSLDVGLGNNLAREGDATLFTPARIGVKSIRWE